MEHLKWLKREALIGKVAAARFHHLYASDTSQIWYADTAPNGQALGLLIQGVGLRGQSAGHSG